MFQGPMVVFTWGRSCSKEEGGGRDTDLSEMSADRNSRSRPQGFTAGR